MATHTTNSDYLIHVDVLDRDCLNTSGQIAMTHVPGKRPTTLSHIDKQDLLKDLSDLRNHYQVDHLVCLLESEELNVLGIQDLLAQARRKGMSAEQFEIPDEGLPSAIQEFAALVDRATQEITNGKTVVMHCRGGKGRTGMLAACCLVQLGHSPDDAIALVRKVRPGTIEPEIKEDYVRHFSKFKSMTL